MDQKFNAISHRFGAVDTKFLACDLQELDPPPPLCVDANCTVRQALDVFAKYRIGAVLVTDSQDTLVGIISERDIVLKVCAPGIDVEKTYVADIMTKSPHTEQMSITIAMALNTMINGGYRHIPIVDEEKCPIGIISIRDICEYIARHLVKELVASQTGITTHG